ncbi:hypothetical protein PIB30_033441 [Stylosanthes scabra]|uniref:Thioredoxin-like fold domain-containing protein n=1 Tax=Stylosanthes scabra TaxID=79078 RepID=A0ABU6TC77_9FABA|nr:hypothetical protein [Stylosanthes scabra]
MQMTKPATSMILILISSVLQLLVLKGGADYIPPSRLEGFVYQPRPFDWDDTVFIEAFYDPVCPDSRDSWPPLRKAIHYYGNRVQLVVHLLPLPYHDNAYVASRALHIVNGLNSSATFPLLDWFFKHQEKFYNAPTRNLSRASIVEKIVNSAAKVAGSSYHTAIKNGFNDTQSDYQTRVSFKYSASRGVYGTPFFYVNGFLLPDTGSAIDFNAWRKVIDPLVGAKSVKNEESPHYLL